MKVIKKDSYPKGTNVFCNDAFHMGQSFGWSPNATQEERVKTKEEAYAGHGCFNAPAGSRIVVMMSNHENADCPYLIIVDEVTGERITIDFCGDRPFDWMKKVQNA